MLLMYGMQFRLQLSRHSSTLPLNLQWKHATMGALKKNICKRALATDVKENQETGSLLELQKTSSLLSVAQ